MPSLAVLWMRGLARGRLARGDDPDDVAFDVAHDCAVAGIPEEDALAIVGELGEED